MYIMLINSKAQFWRIDINDKQKIIMILKQIINVNLIAKDCKNLKYILSAKNVATLQKVSFYIFKNLQIWITEKWKKM